MKMVCLISQNLIFLLQRVKKMGKTDAKNMRLHKTPVGGGSLFYDFFSLKIPLKRWLPLPKNCDNYTLTYWQFHSQKISLYVQFYGQISSRKIQNLQHSFLKYGLDPTPPLNQCLKEEDLVFGGLPLLKQNIGIQN